MRRWYAHTHTYTHTHAHTHAHTYTHTHAHTHTCTHTHTHAHTHSHTQTHTYSLTHTLKTEQSPLCIALRVPNSHLFCWGSLSLAVAESNPVRQEYYKH